MNTTIVKRASNQRQHIANLGGATEGLGGASRKHVLLDEAKVSQHHVARRVEQDVLRFEVPA